jgi:hypothetical protein
MAQTTAEAQAIVDRTTAAITKATTVEDGAKILIATLRQTIKDNPGPNMAPLVAVLDGFEAGSGNLAEALVENTPSEPATS